MANHACTKCGFETTCSHGRWWDRHPATTALCALLAGYLVVSVIVAHPWFGVPVLVVVAALWVDRRQPVVARRSPATSCSFEPRELMARWILRPPSCLGQTTDKWAERETSGT